MELLFNLYKIHSMSGQEGAMRKFIKRYVRENIPGVECVQKDKNLYFVKGEAESYPCVVAHLDQVQTKHSPDFRVLELDGKLFGFSSKNARQEGLGADDKNGIWVALKCLEAFESIKVAFFREEEVGCCGSSDADMSFFKDVRFVLEADRRNAGDLITDICGAICSTEFCEDISAIAEAHGYKETSGLMTDVETLSDNGLGVSAINFSCGYYNPHTDKEYTVVAELENCLDFAMSIIATCTKVYTFERPKWSGYKRFGSGWGKSVYDDFDWDDWYGYNYSGRTSEKKGGRLIPAGAYHEEPVLIDVKDFDNIEDAMWEYLADNAENDIPLSELWAYVSADCDAYGFTYDDFLMTWEDVKYYCLPEGYDKVDELDGEERF